MAASAPALPAQSWRPAPTGGQAALAAAIAAALPLRPSSRMPPVPESASTQRTAPLRTASASQLTLTSLSRPEKPPSATTPVVPERIACAALDWLEKAIVPPPLAWA